MAKCENHLSKTKKQLNLTKNRAVTIGPLHFLKLVCLLPVA